MSLLRSKSVPTAHVGTASRMSSAEDRQALLSDQGNRMELMARSDVDRVEDSVMETGYLTDKMEKMARKVVGDKNVDKAKEAMKEGLAAAKKAVKGSSKKKAIRV